LVRRFVNTPEIGIGGERSVEVGGAKPGVSVTSPSGVQGRSPSGSLRTKLPKAESI